jgi:hypothetical protein
MIIFLLKMIVLRVRRAVIKESALNPLRRSHCKAAIISLLHIA